MNCNRFRPQLALLAYGDVSAAEREQLQAHLRTCPACARELDALQRLRGCLDAVPAPATTVNVAKLYQQAWQRDGQRSRRWRRLAVAAVGLAAAIVLVVLAANVRLGWRDGQLAIAWGSLSDPQPVVSLEKTVASRDDDGRSAELDRRLETLNDIVHALAANLDARDQRQQVDVAELRGRIQFMQQEILRLRAAASVTSAERDNAFVRHEKGDTR